MRKHDAATARLAALGNAAMLGGFALLAALLFLLHMDELRWRDPGAERWFDAALVLAAWLGLLVWLRRSPSPRKADVDVDARASTATDAAADAGQVVPSGNLEKAPMTSFPRKRESILTLRNSNLDSRFRGNDEQKGGYSRFPSGTLVRVIHASQTGVAEQLARQTLQSLQAAGMQVRIDGFDSLALDDLRATERVLFVVSTTGEGDPPDVAVAFSRVIMKYPAALTGLHYGLLALGDSDYEDFCSFGRQLQHWLQASGAQALFDPVEVDREDQAALRHWQHHLAMLSRVSDLPDWQASAYQRWQLTERRLLNPGSVGEPCFHLALQPLQGSVSWQAGDLVEIGPCHAPARVAAWLSTRGLDGRAPVPHEKQHLPLAELLARCRLPEADEIDGLDEEALAAVLQRLPHREYSIASLPDDGAIHLLVRQMCGRGGYLGLGSGWLTEHAPLGAQIALRVRGNVNFRVPRDARPLILIGNGTGLAALRALLKARIGAGHRCNWLLFGERHEAHDFLYREEIERWVRDGQIERVDFAWSRDQTERVHVQQRLREAAEVLLGWVDAGAAIYVCGSLDGLAPGVDAVLRDVLGTAHIEQLREQGRYRRDVY